MQIKALIKIRSNKEIIPSIPQMILKVNQRIKKKDRNDLLEPLLHEGHALLGI